MVEKITITDSTGTTTSFEVTPLNIIKNQYGYLLRLKNDGRTPSQELLDDIKGYEIILGGYDPETMAERYFEVKERHLEKTGRALRVREVVRMLGWWP